MTTTRRPPYEASYAALRERIDAQIAKEKQAGATLADPTWEAPRCVLGHITTAPDACHVCTAERGAR